MPTNSHAQIKKVAPANLSLQEKANHAHRDSAGPASTIVDHPVKLRSLTAQQASDASAGESRVVIPIMRSRETFILRFAKRAFDLIVGCVLLVIASPIILAAATAIRIDTPGNPFFFQTRLGRNGMPFKLFKLRGMFIDARTRFPEFYDYSKKRDLEFCFHHVNDPRVTPAGRFMRRTSIDELPNLWNVVTGDMSLVGPRPEIPEVLALYGKYRDEYLSLKPGITCLSKCTGRDRLTKQETVEFDLGYVRTASFALDLKILWKTFLQVILIRDVF